MADSNKTMLKCAVLLNKREIQAIEWRHFMEDNWNELTAHLRDATILVLTGRHGNESGLIGPAEDFLTEEQVQQVRFIQSFHL